MGAFNCNASFPDTSPVAHANSSSGRMWLRCFACSAAVVLLLCAVHVSHQRTSRTGAIRLAESRTLNLRATKNAFSPSSANHVLTRDGQPLTLHAGEAAPDAPSLHIHETPHQPGSFIVSMGATVWLEPGLPTSVRVGGRTFSASQQQQNQQQEQQQKKLKPEQLELKLQARGRHAGRDVLGSFQRHWWRWAADGLTWETAARLYQTAIVFEQHWQDEAKGTAGSPLTSTFPSFALPAAPRTPLQAQRGFLQFDGDMGGQLYKLSQWTQNARGIGSGMAGTAPLVIFSADLSQSTVLSPFSSFMSAAQHYDGRTLSYGLLGSVSTVPAGHIVEVILTAGRGINAAMLSWGDWLLARSQKTRGGAWKRDMTLRKLGYCTQNGAYYYYNPPAKTSYEQLMVLIAEDANRTRTPFRYWLADSWWYRKASPPRGLPRGGVVEWEALSDDQHFPSGLAHVYAKTGWRVQAHARYWSAKAVYAQVNGGEFPFLVDRHSGVSLPQDRAFWDMLFRRARRWGLETFEQDWMNAQTERFPPLTTNATLGRDWMRQMGAAAGAQNVSIQLCMAYSRHVLQSVESDSMTQVRGSGDYRAGNDLWAPLGVTGLFAYSLGLAASKDTFWTTREQPGNRWGARTQEPFSRLQATVATLTMGPVCPSDALGRADRSLIMRSATADGTLLHPGRPATLIDLGFVAAAGFGAELGREVPRGDVWSSDWIIDGLRFAVVLAARLRAPFDLSPTDALLSTAPRVATTNETASFVAVEATSPQQMIAVVKDAHSPLHLRRCGKRDFQLWHLAQRHSTGWALLGEVADKVVAVSPARFLHIDGGAHEMRVLISGAAGERVSVSFAGPPTRSSGAVPVVVHCTLPASGRTMVRVPAQVCKPEEA